ncbi:MAG TPA: tetratricopeptide repeat protein [Desulfuromonadales bacterium]|nr:tetratricopeptide repeat protein [Desulfuromonadales bacterium]
MAELRKEQGNDSLQKLPTAELVRLGQDHLAAGRTGVARLHFAVALEREPSSTEALFGLGECLRRETETQGAVQIFTLVVKNDPDHVGAMLALARIYRSQGNYDLSLEWAGKALFKAPDAPEILTEMAVTSSHMGRDPMAEPMFRQVAELKPEQASSHNNLGFNYLLQGKHDKAIESFSRALAIEPRNRMLQNNLATAYFLNGEETRAKEIFIKTLGEAAAWNNLGYLYMTQGKWEKSEQALKKAVDLNPQLYMRARENLARLADLREKAGR